MVIACVVATADHRGHTAVSRDLVRVKSLVASSAISAWIADRQKGSMMLVLGSAGCSPGTSPAEHFWSMESAKTASAQRKRSLSCQGTVASSPKYPTRLSHVG